MLERFREVINSGDVAYTIAGLFTGLVSLTGLFSAVVAFGMERSGWGGNRLDETGIEPVTLQYLAFVSLGGVALSLAVILSGRLLRRQR